MPPLKKYHAFVDTEIYAGNIHEAAKKFELLLKDKPGFTIHEVDSDDLVKAILEVQRRDTVLNSDDD